jgi:hypothetical protein
MKARPMTRSWYILCYVITIVFVFLFIITPTIAPEMDTLCLIGLVLTGVGFFHALYYRIQNAGMSGWYFLCAFIPYLNQIFYLVMMLIPPKGEDSV